jgi:signal transduction histidine kinase
VRGGVGIVEDVSAYKQIQARLQLADRLASMGMLAAGVAHEINNPLTYVQLGIEMALRHVDQLAAAPAATAAATPATALATTIEKMRDVLRSAADGAERVRLIVRDCKMFSRGPSDPSEERRALIDVRQVLDSAINLARNEFKHRAFMVKEYKRTPPLFADEARLGQVFLNLLVNAAHAIPEGAVADNRIQVTARQEGADAIIEVSDTGVGIPVEIRDRIFEPFVTGKADAGGTGLGLWICRGIVEEMGGDISVESPIEEGKGSRFRVRLPAAAGQLEAIGAAAPLAPPHEHARRRILIVDDEPMIARTLADELGQHHDVVTTSSGRHALDMLRRDDGFDLVLCDVMMPDVGGLDVYETLRREERPVHARVRFMTGGAYSERARALLLEVGRPMLEKPFRLSDVETILDELGR